MSKRYDVLSPRKRKDQEKPYWHRVGTAWENDKGISITFDSLPLPDEKGEVRVSLFEPREKDAAPAKANNTAQAAVQSIERTAGRRTRDSMDDEIPF